MAIFPLKFFPDKTRFNFIGLRWWGFAISMALTLISLGLVATKGLNLGIDFTGGVLMEVRSEQAAVLSPMRESLGALGYGEISLQNIGSDRDVMIRIQVAEGVDQNAVIARVKEVLGHGVEYRKIDYVGPVVGGELIRGAAISVMLSFVAIMLYVWFRFEWQFGIGAIAALIHDAVMMVGFYAITGYEFGLTAIAAILTVIGYSINDSVVIYDRIRENMRKFKKMPMDALLNISINDTLSRTVMTASTTLLAAIALAWLGGEVIRGFSLSLVFGVITGTYSSIFISAPALIYLNIRPDTPAAEPEVA